jgi:ABC-type nitrate/sulfonate/bicarbonate transport system permease component
MFAGVVILAVMGIAATAIVRWIHARVVFWEALPDQRGTE